MNKTVLLNWWFKFLLKINILISIDVFPTGELLDHTEEVFEEN